MMLARLRSTAKRVARRGGFQVARRTVRSDPQLRRAKLLDWLNVDLLIDVGANVGQYGSELRAGGYTGRILSLEPQSEPFRRLSALASSDELWTVRQVALGSHSGREEINISPLSEVSSLLEMGERQLEMDPDSAFVGAETIRLEPGDTVVEEFINDSSRVGLKLDVQGFEMEVLAGAPALLRRAVFVECEFILVPLYEGQAKISDLVSTFYETGLRLAAVEPGQMDMETGAAIWLDAIFIREPRAPGPPPE
jgi:FkbM family methyltransferase